MKLLLFAILAVLCWPLAIAILVLYPVLWLLTLPFRLIGLAVTGVFALVSLVLLARPHPSHPLSPTQPRHRC